MKKEEIEKIVKTAKDLKVYPILTDRTAFTAHDGIHFNAVSKDFHLHASLTIGADGNVTNNFCDNLFAWVHDMSRDHQDDVLEALAHLSGSTQERTAWLLRQAEMLAD